MRLTTLITLNSLVVSAFAASASDWTSRTIYQFVTDRFAQTDGSSPPCDTGPRQYCGGTWQGAINKLDYIQNMGFDAVWISPIVKNIEDNTTYGQAYHGYWTGDINSLNEHFGSASDLQALSSALHSRGMYLMVDVVVNHMAADAVPPNYSTLEPFDVVTDFHPFCFISDYSNQTDVEQCWLGDNNVPLPDLDTEDQTIVTAMYDWIKGLVSNYTVDGLRIDTVKHIRQDFWPDFASNAGVFTLGEILIGNVSYVAPYTDVIDSALDYPTYYQLFNAFSSTSGNLSALQDFYTQTQTSYKTGAINTGSFLENQDNPRLQSVTTDQSLVKNGMAWNFVTDGIPILYYGQEQGYTGGNDPDNREALWLSGYEENKPLVNHVKSLNAARKAAGTANSSFYSTPVKFVSLTSNTLALSKPPMLTLLTNGGNSSSASWSVSDTGFSANEQLMEVLSCTSVQADGNGAVSMSTSDGSPQVILPQSAVSQSGMCSGNSSSNSNDALSSFVSSSRSWAVGMGVALATALL